MPVERKRSFPFHRPSLGFQRRHTLVGSFVGLLEDAEGLIRARFAGGLFEQSLRQQMPTKEIATAIREGIEGLLTRTASDSPWAEAAATRNAIGSTWLSGTAETSSDVPHMLQKRAVHGRAFSCHCLCQRQTIHNLQALYFE